MTDAASATQVAETYYDSADADNFYRLIWGGEDIHIGLYAEGRTISDASRETVLVMANRVAALKRPGTKVLDIGAGYGGAARVLARHFEAEVTCLNLSEKENERNRQLTAAQELADRVQVRHGSFEAIPEADESFDVVWSQDAILHSGNREKVLSEVARVLKPGGDFIFTDPMQSDDLADPAALQPIYDRIHLTSLGSLAFYRQSLAALGFAERGVDLQTEQMRTHYARVGAELRQRRAEIAPEVSSGYIDRMLKGLQHWVDGAEAGLLVWGILHFEKQRP